MSNGRNPGSAATAETSGHRHLWWAVAAIAAFVLAANLPVLAHDWVYFDDDINVVLNPHLTGLTTDSLGWAWRDAAYTRRFMPLGWLLFDGLFRIGGLNPFPYHFASWLLSTANALALFFIVRRFLPRSSDSSWRTACAALAVIALAVHPLRAETAGWASGLIYLVSGLVAAFAVLVDFPDLAAARSAASAWAGALLFLLSLLVYPVLLGLPLLLIIAAVPAAQSWPETARALAAAARRYGVWLALAAVVGFVNLRLAASSNPFPAHIDSDLAGLAARLERTARLLGHYCSETIWPGPTAPFYGQNATAFTPRRILLVLAAASVALALLVRSGTRQATARFLLAAGASLLPFLGLLNREQTASDRFIIVLFGVIAVGVACLLVRISRGSYRAVAAVGILAATALLFPRYRAALAIWSDTSTLQARVDDINAAHADVRLNFARPAIHDFLRGEYGASRPRLQQGFSRFGPNPELIAAARFIEETRTSLTGDARDPAMPPYAFMHFDLATKHRTLGHTYAADVHANFARQFAASVMGSPAAP